MPTRLDTTNDVPVMTHSMIILRPTPASGLQMIAQTSISSTGETWSNYQENAYFHDHGHGLHGAPHLQASQGGVDESREMAYQSRYQTASGSQSQAWYV